MFDLGHTSMAHTEMAQLVHLLDLKNPLINKKIIKTSKSNPSPALHTINKTAVKFTIYAMRGFLSVIQQYRHGTVN